jgi:lysophospholipase L1-like esterase
MTPIMMVTPPPSLHWISPADRRLQYRGRWSVRDARALAVNTGSQLAARFSGDRLVLRFDAGAYPHEPPQLWVRLDEHPWQKVEVAPEIDLAPTPPHTSHLLRVVFKGAREWDNRWKPPLQTAIVLTGIGLAEGGTLLEPPPLPALRIEFLGDSITEGVLLHRLDRPFPEVWPERADGRLGYAFQTGERLGADTRVVGFGRQGLTIYLSLIRAAYPAAHILALRPFNGAHADDIRAVVEQRVAAGDPRLHFVDTTGWLDATIDTTDGVHPNAMGHRKSAGRLEAKIRAVLARFDDPRTPVVE